MNFVVPKSGGVRFEDGGDRARLIVSGAETNGAYALLEWRIAPGRRMGADDVRDFGAHRHRECEETFLIMSGDLEFLIGDAVVQLGEGDFVRAPKGVRHGYQNTSGAPVTMLVSFVPAGLERLFVKYRTDQQENPGPGFVVEATRDHASEFGLPYP
jgi:mannose-6-phosphate isomerase-like protein (cupin superfamily)